MASSLEPDDESSEGWALDDCDGDAAYVDKPTARSQLLHAPMKKSLTFKGRGEEGTPLEKEERNPMMRTRCARPQEVRRTLFRSSPHNPYSICLHRNMPP